MSRSLRKVGRYLLRKLRELAERQGVAAFVSHHREFILATYHKLIAQGVPPDEALLATIRALLRHAL